MLVLRRAHIEVDCVRDKPITFDRVSSGSAGSTIDCKFYHPTVDPGRLTGSFPGLKAGGSVYQAADYYHVAKGVQEHAPEITNELKLDLFEPGYDEQNNKRLMPALKAIALKVSSGESTIDPSMPSVPGKDVSGIEGGKYVSSPQDVYQESRGYC